MPSFLNKVFGHKKVDEKEVARPTREAPDGTLLDGKYEAIPPMLSPSDSTFAEAQQTRDSDRDTAISLLKHKARGVFQKSAHKSQLAVPHLTLRLPVSKENSDSRALGAVFDADPVSLYILDDAVIAAKRLSPLEALNLIRACAQTISERGLETLGIMHPHWFSASPDVQRKLISLFIRSLTPQSQITTLAPTPSAATSAFENELHYTRSPHDVAALLRWGLRHLTLENARFGKDSADWAWYTTFFQSERNASYPPKAFSQLLLPHLPASHIQLLTVTLDMIASLAAHAETNGISGSKLSKFLGIWLLVATRAEESDDWSRFYARWERAGRILEHLFLAHLREESLGLRLPTRLQELVQYYPYNKGSPSKGDDLFPRPLFSTRQYDALCIRVETILMPDGRQPKQHPIQLLLEAFRLPLDNSSGDEHIALWQGLKTTVFEDVASSSPQFARIFVDETIQLLSRISPGNNPSSPTLLASPITKVVTRKRSSSISKVLERALAKSNANNGNGSTPASPTSPTTPVVTDWAQFSMSGFGETPSTQPLAVLFSDEDIEVTVPRQAERPRGKSRSRRRRSEEREPSDSPQLDPESSIVESRVGSVRVVHIDEAFIDFWSDAIVDPISNYWPTFVLCGLKELPSAPLRWLVIEQTYIRQESPRNPSPEGRRGRSPRPSFRSDMSGFRIGSVLSSARKRFSVFSKSTSDLDPKRSKLGEFGQVLVEEDDSNKDAKATISSGTTVGIADQLKVNEIGAVPIAAAVVDPVSQAKDVSAAAEVPSTEPTPQSGAGQSEPRPKVDHVADSLGAADKADSQTSDPTLNPTAAEDGRTQVDPISQDVVQAKDVARLADGDAHLPVVQSEITNVAETVAVPEPTITEVANPILPTDVAVHGESPGAITHVDKQPSRESFTTSAAEAVPYDNAADVQDTVGTEMPAQLQDAVAIVGGIKGVAETEIQTPVREGAVVVEETPSPEVEVNAQPKVLEDDDAVPEPAPALAVLEPEASLVALAVEEPSGGIEEGAQDVPDAADQPSKFASEEQAAIVDTVEVPPTPEAAPRVLMEAKPRVLEIRVPTPVVETAALIDETPGPETATEENAPAFETTQGLAGNAAEAPLAKEAQGSIEAAPASLPKGVATLAAGQTAEDLEVPRAAERLPLQEDDDEEDVPEITVGGSKPVDVGVEPVMVASARDPASAVGEDVSVEDGSGGEPETVGHESEVVSLPVPVATEALSAVAGVPEEAETDKTNGVADVDVAAEQLVTFDISTQETAAPSEEIAAEA